MEDALPSVPIQMVAWEGEPPWPLNMIIWGYSYKVLFMTLVVVGVVALVFGLLARNLKLVPGRKQTLLEMVVGFLQEVVYGTLGPKDGRTFLPLIGTIFLFVWTANMIGILPTGGVFEWINHVADRPGGPNLMFDLGDWGTAVIPGAIEPSRSVNFPWGLGIMVFFLMHILAIKRKGMGTYLDEYFEPHLGKLTIPYQKTWARVAMSLFGFAAAGAFGFLVGWYADSQWETDLARWVLGGALGVYASFCFLLKPRREPKAVGVPNLFMAPLNIIGKFAEILSMCFRLFGNIFGGAIIIALIGGFVKPILPILLQGFFGLFVGTVQAFVFAVLCLTYIAVEIHEEEDIQVAGKDIHAEIHVPEDTPAEAKA